MSISLFSVTEFFILYIIIKYIELFVANAPSSALCLLNVIFNKQTLNIWCKEDYTCVNNQFLLYIKYYRMCKHLYSNLNIIL